MLWVDWDTYELYDQAASRTCASPPRDAYCWRDLVNGTYFFLAPDRAAAIASAGLAYIGQVLSSRGAEAVVRFLQGEDEEAPAEARRFGGLPFLFPKSGSEQPVVAWRLADHFLVRAGLTYAVASEEQRRDWPQWRLAALLQGADIYGGRLSMLPPLTAPLADLLRMVESCLVDDPPEAAHEYRLDLVKGGVVKTKAYFLETNKLPNIRGGSRLLDEINCHRLPYLVASCFTPECVIYAGGGNILAVAPAGRGEELAARVEELYRRVTLTALNVAASMTITLADIAPSRFRKITAALERQVKKRQMYEIPWEPEGGDVNFGLAPGDKPIEVRRGRAPEDGQLCAHCNLRPANRYLPHAAAEGEALCNSCFHRVLAGGAVGRKGFQEEYEEFCQQHGLAILSDTTRPQDLNELARAKGNSTPYIAVIYADGNNLGRIVMEELDSLTAYRCFSERTKEVATEATFRAVGEVQKDRAVEFIALGGDDILFLVPASRALAVAVRLGKLFDVAFADISTGQQRATLSIGVAIGHSMHPVKYLFDTATGLLKMAKKKAKAMEAAGQPRGTVDVAVMESFTNFSSSIKAYRETIERRYKTAFFRPYTWEQAIAIGRTIQKLRAWPAGRQFTLAMRQAMGEMRPREVDLFYLYRLGRLREPDRQKIQSMMYQLADVLQARSGAAYFWIGQECLAPWLDLVELWDYCHGLEMEGDMGHDETLATGTGET